MPELRKDPVVGRWVIIATERARRPGNFVDMNSASEEGDPAGCRFCRDRQSSLYADENVRIIPSQEFLSGHNSDLSHHRHGLYEVIQGVGRHEIVIETPRHVGNIAELSLEEIRRVLLSYAARFRELGKDSSLKYVVAYKNHGVNLGEENSVHSRSHILAAAVEPLRVKQKLWGAKEHFARYNRCVYCDILHQETAEKKRIVWETEHFVAVTPFAPRFLFEMLVLPRRHHCDFAPGVEGVEEDLAKMLKTLTRKLQTGLDNPAYCLVIHTAPYRREGEHVRRDTIEKEYHWHMELMPRLTRVAGFEKGTGFYICSVPPEDMAAYLREVVVS